MASTIEVVRDLLEVCEEALERAPSAHQSEELIDRVLASIPPAYSPARRVEHDIWIADYAYVRRLRAAIAKAREEVTSGVA